MEFGLQLAGAIRVYLLVQYSSNQKFRKEKDLILTSSYYDRFYEKTISSDFLYLQKENELLSIWWAF